MVVWIFYKVEPSNARYMKDRAKAGIFNRLMFNHVNLEGHDLTRKTECL